MQKSTSFSLKNRKNSSSAKATDLLCLRRLVVTPSDPTLAQSRYELFAAQLIITDAFT